MENTFESEDKRKDAVFNAWHEFLRAQKATPATRWLDEVFEGIAAITSIKKNRITLDLEDGRKIRHIAVSANMASHIRESDTLCLALGRCRQSWELIEIVSIGTLITGSRSGLHVTINPEMTGPVGETIDSIH